MTTNKPTIAAWAPSTALAKLESRHNNAPCILTDRPAEFNDVALVRLADYEALQAECEKLRKDSERYNLLASMLVAVSTGAVLTPQQEALFGAMNTITHLRTADEVHAMFDTAMQGDQP